MQEGKRQKQVGALLLQELSDIFQRLGLSMIDGGLVSLTAVKITPDLLEARVYLSLFQVKDIPATMKKVEERAWEIKRDLAARVKQQLRRIPTLTWVHDDTLDHADKMEELFRKIKTQRPAEGVNPDRPDSHNPGNPDQPDGHNPDGKEGPQ